MHTAPLILALPALALAGTGYHKPVFGSVKHNSPMINRLKARAAQTAPPTSAPLTDSKYVPGFLDQFLAALGPARFTTFMPASCDENDTKCKTDLCQQRFPISERVMFDEKNIIFICEFLNPVGDECPDPWMATQPGARCPGSAEEVLATVVANSEWKEDEAREKLEALVPGMFAKPKEVTKGSSTEKGKSSSAQKGSSSTKSSSNSTEPATKKDDKKESSKTTSTTVSVVTEFEKRAEPTESAEKEEKEESSPVSPSKASQSSAPTSKADGTSTGSSSKTTATGSAKPSKDEEEEEEVPKELLTSDPTAALPQGETRPLNIPIDIPVRPMPPGPVQQTPSFFCYNYTIAEKGETCYWVTARVQSPIDQFLRLNPQVNGVTCDKLWENYAYCIRELTDFIPWARLSPEFEEEMRKQQEADRAAALEAQKGQNGDGSKPPKAGSI